MNKYQLIKLAVLAAQKRKGFSINAITGQSPKSGFMVAVEGYEHKVTNTGEIAEYIEKHYTKALRGNLFIGGWHFNGSLYLDLSRNIIDVRDAVERGILNHQKAIFDIKKKKNIELPLPQLAGTYTQQVDYAKEYAKRFA